MNNQANKFVVYSIEKVCKCLDLVDIWKTKCCEWLWNTQRKLGLKSYFHWAQNLKFFYQSSNTFLQSNLAGKCFKIIDDVLTCITHHFSLWVIFELPADHTYKSSLYFLVGTFKIIPRILIFFSISMDWDVSLKLDPTFFTYIIVYFWMLWFNSFKTYSSNNLELFHLNFRCLTVDYASLSTYKIVK